MKAILALTLLAVVVVSAAVLPRAPIRPNFHETFEASGTIHAKTANGTFWGIGRLVRDQPKGLALESWEFSEHSRERNIHILERYDLGFEYFMFWDQRPPHPHLVCHKQAVKPPMHTWWGWLHDAHYAGKSHVEGRTYDDWTYTAGDVHLSVLVTEERVDRPVYFFRHDKQRHEEIHFITFDYVPPNATWFRVPDSCKNASLFEAEPEREVESPLPGQADPPRPVISETFEAVGSLAIRTKNVSAFGFGRWAIDQPHGHGLENFEFEEHHHRHNIHFLQRYDLGFDYRLTWNQSHRTCQSHAVKPPMPPRWQWLKDAKYTGKRHIGQHTYDEWTGQIQTTTLRVAVDEHNANQPVYYSATASTELREAHFAHWSTRNPDPHWFDVPAECHNKTLSMQKGPELDSPEVAPVNEADVCGAAAENAQAYVAQKCAYVYGGIGDCYASGFDNSGFVTAAFADAGRRIPRMLAEQQENGNGCTGGVRPGDLLFVDTPATHVAIYVGGNVVAHCAADGLTGCTLADYDVDAMTGGCRRYC
jgi:cell wall-associated NlpC family hydrolase